MNWTVQSYGLDLSLNYSFYLNITDYTADFTGSSYRTNYFNISSTPTSTTKNTPKKCPTNNSSMISNHTNRMIEVGLGIGLGIPLALSLLSIAFLIHRLRESRKPHVIDYKDEIKTTTEKKRVPYNSYHDVSGYGEVHEVSSRDEVVHEVPGSSTPSDFRR